MNKKYFNSKKSSIILLLAFIIGIVNSNRVLCYCYDEDHLAIESVHNHCQYNSIDDIKNNSIEQKSCIDIPILTTFDIRLNNLAKNSLKKQSVNKLYRYINTNVSQSSQAISSLKILYSNTILDSLNTVILLI